MIVALRRGLAPIEAVILLTIAMQAVPGGGISARANASGRRTCTLAAKQIGAESGIGSQ